jgi:S1-C subfamily serine protease
VKPGGIAELLGLKNADILVSAHGYVVQTPIQFYKYLQLLRSDKQTWIEVRREGKPMILKVQVTAD